MSRGRIPPWKRARRLSSGRARRRGCGGLEQCGVLVDPWQSASLVTLLHCYTRRGAMDEGCYDNKEKRVAWTVLVRGARVA